MQSFIASININRQVEQQPGVVNPTFMLPQYERILWDPDDLRVDAFGGAFAVGGNYTIPMRRYADWTGPLITFIVRCGTKAGVIMTIEIPELRFMQSRVVDQKVDRHEWSRTLHVRGPRYEHQSPLLQPVAGSNGGVAKLITVEFRIQNVTSKRLRSIAGNAIMRLDQTEKGAEPILTPNSRAGDPRIEWST